MKKRLNNIELLRIISMLMILILHLLRFGGLLDTYQDFSIRSLLVWGLESFCFVAVNCYVLISGYFLVDSKFKFRKIFTLWLEVLFYSLIIYLGLLFMHKTKFSIKTLLTSIFPILLKNYWFITVYIILYALSPFLNKLVHSLSKQQYMYLIAIILIFFSLWATIISPSETLNYGGSYSISWFICLYLIAGFLKKFYKDNSIKSIILLCVYFMLSIINMLAYFFIKKFNITFFSPDFLYNYHSITVVLAAISLFLFFKNLKIKNNIINKIIVFFAPTTFGIYLIHENPNIRLLLWNKFSFITHENLIEMIFFIIIIPIILFILFSLFDKVRNIIFGLFSKLIKNNKSIKVCEKLEDILCQK